MELIEGIVRSVVIICLLAVLLELILPDGSMRPYIKLVMGLLLLLAVLQPVWHLLAADALQVFSPVISEEKSGGNWDDVARTGAALNEQVQANTGAGLQTGLERQIEALINLSSNYRVNRVAVELNETTAKDTAADQTAAARVQTVGSIAQVSIWLQYTSDAGTEDNQEQTTAEQQQTKESEMATSKIEPVGVSRITVDAMQNTHRTTVDEAADQEVNSLAAAANKDLSTEQKKQTEKICATIAGYYNLQSEQIKVIFN